jgi:UDP-glucuronate 4-epimerase
MFTKAIIAGEPIQVFNHGKMIRDFTFIDDIAAGVVAVHDRPPPPNPGHQPAQPDPGRSHAPYRIFNIGNNQPVELIAFIEAIEKAVGKPATKHLMDMQPGDVPATFADVSELEHWTGFKPAMPIEEGVARFVKWYRSYYRV